MTPVIPSWGMAAVDVVEDQLHHQPRQHVTCLGGERLPKRRLHCLHAVKAGE
jgi:hypothetical protein